MCKTIKVREMKSNFLRCVSKKFEANGSRENRKPNTTRWQPPKKVTCAIDEQLNPSNLPKPRKKNLLEGLGFFVTNLCKSKAFLQPGTKFLFSFTS